MLIGGTMGTASYILADTQSGMELAYKNIATVVKSSHHAGLATMVAKLVPMICIKG